jgi:hypothetical protein
MNERATIATRLIANSHSHKHATIKKKASLLIEGVFDTDAALHSVGLNPCILEDSTASGPQASTTL